MIDPSYWLMKSEPDVYSIDDLCRDGSTPWEGVRNYQARNFMTSQRIGDRVLFYHSNAKPPGIVGLAEVVRVAYPDASQFSPESPYFDKKATLDHPRWWHTDIGYLAHFDRIITLDELRHTPDLDDMLLFKRSRLSIQPINAAMWHVIVALRKKIMHR